MSSAPDKRKADVAPVNDDVGQGSGYDVATSNTVGSDASVQFGETNGLSVGAPAPMMEAPLRRKTQRSAPRPPPETDGPSPPVSAVFPLPPAALGANLNKADPAPTNMSRGAAGESDKPGTADGQLSAVSRSSRQRYSSQNGEAGSPPEGSHVYKTEVGDTNPADAEGKSLAELKMSFTTRMNEAIRMQRERMRSLLSDVDSKIVSLKKEHGLSEPGAGDKDEPVTPPKAANQLEIPAFSALKIDSDNKENDSRYVYHGAHDYAESVHICCLLFCCFHLSSLTTCDQRAQRGIVSQFRGYRHKPGDCVKICRAAQCLDSAGCSEH
jgi:hypothetical protein